MSEPGAPGQALARAHPARALPAFLAAFGPLVFPLFRAALARKRILLVGPAPVAGACSFVYLVSVLANVPQAAAALAAAPPARLRPLFSIGVHDIARLPAAGWVACTTDEILAEKTALWDVVVRLPAAPRAWPAVRASSGAPIRATQRDLRRFRALARSLALRYRPRADGDSSEDDDDGAAPGAPRSIEDVCEKLAWREIAYSSFMWWASAGEQQRSDAEADDGRLLLDTHFVHTPTAQDYSFHDDGDDDATTSSASPGDAARRRSSRRRSALRRQSTNLASEGVGCEEMDVIAYFHRMAQTIFTVLGENAAAAEARAADDDDEAAALVAAARPVEVSIADMERMGLDRYSEVDVVAVREIVGRWWGREAEVERWRISCCGIEC